MPASSHLRSDVFASASSPPLLALGACGDGDPTPIVPDTLRTAQALSLAADRRQRARVVGRLQARPERPHPHHRVRPADPDRRIRARRQRRARLPADRQRRCTRHDAEPSCRRRSPSKLDTDWIAQSQRQRRGLDPPSVLRRRRGAEARQLSVRDGHERAERDRHRRRRDLPRQHARASGSSGNRTAASCASRPPGEHAAAGRHRRRPRTLLLSGLTRPLSSMVTCPTIIPRLPQRRPALRSVPSHRALRRPPAPAPVAPRPLAQPDDSLAETLRKLWRRKKMIAAVTILLGGTAAAIAWSMPSYYSAEARVLVGVQSPRVMNAEAIITDASPDAERVQNEGFVLQSRTLAKMVIDKLKLAENPSFNPELRKPSPLGAPLRRRADSCRPSVNDWLKNLTSKPAGRQPHVQPITDNSLSPHDNRLIDIFLGHSRRLAARPQPRAERQGRRARSRHRRVDGQHARRHLPRLPAQGQGRDHGPGRQVPDGPRRRAARAGEANPTRRSRTIAAPTASTRAPAPTAA